MPHTHTHTPCVRAERGERGCGVSPVSIYFLIAAKLSWPSWQVPSFSLEETGRKGRPTDSRVEDRWRWGGEAVHYSARKKTIHGTFNFRSPSAASIQGESTAGAWIPSFNRLPPPFPSSDLRGRTRMKSVIFLLDIVRHGEEESRRGRATRSSSSRGFDYLKGSRL